MHVLIVVNVIFTCMKVLLLHVGLVAYSKHLTFAFTFMHLQMFLCDATHIAFKIDILLVLFSLCVVFLDTFLIANNGRYVCSSLCVVKGNACLQCFIFCEKHAPDIFY